MAEIHRVISAFGYCYSHRTGVKLPLDTKYAKKYSRKRKECVMKKDRITKDAMKTLMLFLELTPENKEKVLTLASDLLRTQESDPSPSADSQE